MIFISFSSKDQDLANDLHKNLNANCIEDVFLAHHDDDGIKLGESFDDGLKRAIQKTTTLLILLSQNWLESSWCLAEYQTAMLLGKRIIPIFFQDPDTLKVPADIGHRQGVSPWSNYEKAWIKLIKMLESEASDKLSSLFKFRESITRYTNTPIYDLSSVTYLSILEWFVTPDVTQEVSTSSSPQEKGLKALISNNKTNGFVTLVGPAGIGKSTLLKYLAANSLMDNPDVVGIKRLEPVFIRLRDLTEITEGSLSDKLRKAVKRLPRFNYVGEGIPEDFLFSWRSASKREWLFLFDALDEVNTESLREIGILLNDLLTVFPNSHYVISSRNKSIVKDALGPSASIDVFRIEPPTSIQALQIAKHWNEETTDEFPTLLKHISLGGLADTPLGISMMSALSKERLQTISNRYELYEEFISLHIRGLKRRGDGFRVLGQFSVAMPILELIAVESYKNNFDINTKFLIERILFVLQRLNISSIEGDLYIKAQEYLTFLTEQSGFFDGSTWRHNSFCEFLVATRMSKMRPDSLKFQSLIKIELKNNREGVLGFIFSHWKSQRESDDERQFEAYRVCFETIMGQREVLKWWQKIFRRQEPQEKRKAPIQLGSIQASIICDWIWSLGGAPIDIEEDAISLLAEEKYEMASRTMNFCRNIFSDEGQRELDSLELWSTIPRLKNRLNPWVDDWLKEIKHGDGTNDDIALCNLILRTGAVDKVRELIDECAFEENVQKVVISAMNSIAQTPQADKLAQAFIDGFESGYEKRIQYLDGLKSALELLVEFDEAPMNNEIYQWAKSDIKNPISYDIVEIAKIFSEFEKTVRIPDIGGELMSLLGITHEYAEKFPKGFPRILRRLSGLEISNFSKSDLFFRSFELVELIDWNEQPNISERLNIFLNWYITHFDRENKENPLFNSLKSYAISKCYNLPSLIKLKGKLANLVTYDFFINWFHEKGALATDRELFSEINIIYLEDVRVNLLTTPSIRLSVKISLLEASIKGLPEISNDESLVETLRVMLLEKYDEWLLEKPEDVDILRARANLYFEMNLWEKGLLDINLILKKNEQAELDPVGPDLMLKAWFLWFLERTEDALKITDKSLILDDSQIDGWFLRASLHEDLGLWYEAIASCDEGIKTTNDSLQFERIKYRCQSSLGLLREALDTATKTIELGGTDGDWLEEKAWLLSCLGDVAESEVVLSSCDPKSESFEIKAAKIQNALINTNISFPKTFCPYSDESPDFDSWITVLCLFASDKSRKLEILKHVRKPLSVEDSSSQTFWLAVVSEIPDLAEVIINRLIENEDEAELRWIYSDYIHLLQPLVPNWVSPLAERSYGAAETLSKKTISSLILPLTTRSTDSGDIPENQFRKIKILPNEGLLCGEHSIHGYDEEFAICSSILEKQKYRTLVVIPLLNTGFIYAQANCKWEPEDDFDFKICIPVLKLDHYEFLFEMINSRNFHTIIVTDRKFHETLIRHELLQTLRSKFICKPQKLPYRKNEVNFVTKSSDE